MSQSRLRRRFPRIPSGFAVLVNPLGARPEEEFAVTADVGLGGLSLVSSESYGIETHLELVVTIEGEVISARVRVVYENELPDGRLEIGVEFLDISEAHRDVLTRLIRLHEG